MMLSYSSAYAKQFFADFSGMKRTTAKIVPKLPNFEQKQCRMNIAQEMLMTFNDDPGMLKKIITGDESWTYGCTFN